MEIQIIQSKIYEIRGVRVMLDFDLAEMYHVETRRLKEQVKRNIERFPDDFMFQLTKPEWSELIANCDKLPENIKHSPVTPYAFTQEGVSMLSGVLRSPIAVQVNIGIMRAFVALRQFAMVTLELSMIRERLKQLERADEEAFEAVNDLSEYTREEIDNIYNAIAALSIKPSQLDKPRPRIGFKKD